MNTPEKYYETGNDLGGMIFALLISLPVIILMVIAIVPTYGLCWLGEKLGWWEFPEGM